jgi:CBS domain-containing protein
LRNLIEKGAEMKKARDLFTGQDLTVISKHETVYDAARLMSEKMIGALPVVEGDKIIGIFSERDVMNRVVARSLNPSKTTVEQVMTKELLIGTPDDEIPQILILMKQANIRHLPIVDADKLVGIISFRDLLQADISEKAQEIKIMTAYIHDIPPTFES